MLPANSPVGVDDVYNAIVVEGDAVDRVTLEGRGAGGGPTASSVIADICDLARGVKYHPFTLPVDKLEDRDFSSLDELKSAYYMRLTVLDAPGVLAEITRIFSQENISLCSFLQRSHQPKQGVQIVITTHITQEAAMQRATRAIAARPEVTEPPHIIRIENFAE
jgi:homoserine dehydrogenase